MIERETTAISERIKPENIVWLDLRPKLREFVDYLAARSGQWTTIYDARDNGIGEGNFHGLWGELKGQLPEEWSDRFLQSAWMNPEYGGRRYKGYRLVARLVDEDTLGKQGSDVPSVRDVEKVPVEALNDQGFSLGKRESETPRAAPVVTQTGGVELLRSRSLSEESTGTVQFTSGEIYVLAFVLKQPRMQELLVQLGIALKPEEKRRIDEHLYNNYQSKRFSGPALKLVLENLNSKLRVLFADAEGVTKENWGTPALSWLALLAKASSLTDEQKDEFLNLVGEIGKGVSNLKLSGPS
ncbi:MAG: hypothetical protein Q7S60_02075 [bacterium]|nr:hypothetical protein [bacterium]